MTGYMYFPSPDDNDSILKPIEDARRAHVREQNRQLDRAFDQLAETTLHRLYQHTRVYVHNASGGRKKLADLLTTLVADKTQSATGDMRHNTLDLVALRRLQAAAKGDAHIEVAPRIEGDNIKLDVAVSYTEAHHERSIRWEPLETEPVNRPKALVIGRPFDQGVAQLADASRRHAEDRVAELGLMTLRDLFEELADVVQQVDEARALFETRCQDEHLSKRQVVESTLKSLNERQLIRLELAEKRDASGGWTNIVSELFVSSPPESFTVQLKKSQRLR